MALVGLGEAGGDHPPELRDEAAIRAFGGANGSVVVTKARFAWQLDGPDG